MQQPLRPFLAAVACVALGGCASERVGYNSYGAAPPASAAAPQPTDAPVDLSGAWRLAAPSGAACTMHLGNQQGGQQEPEGTIRPEGGCPGDFYTSRRWTFEGNSLVIRDHNRTELARLRMASPGHFEGSAVSGEQLTLTR